MWMLLVAFFIFVGCTKGKKVRCKDLVYEIPFGIYLVGYSAETVDTMIIISYEPGSNFTGQQKRDTMYNIDTLNSSDTIRTNFSGGSYTECKFYFSGTLDTFFIKDVKYQSAREWDDKDNCLSARSVQYSANEINLNEKIIRPIKENHAIYIKK
jgi:hypothetical protein